jgi:hypothetical protein
MPQHQHRFFVFNGAAPCRYDTQFRSDAVWRQRLLQVRAQLFFLVVLVSLRCCCSSRLHCYVTRAVQLKDVYVQQMSKTLQQ